MKDVLKAINVVRTHIVESEMGGNVDKQDPWHPLLASLWRLHMKVEDEIDLNRSVPCKTCIVGTSMSKDSTIPGAIFIYEGEGVELDLEFERCPKCGRRLL